MSEKFMNKVVSLGVIINIIIYKFISQREQHMKPKKFYYFNNFTNLTTLQNTFYYMYT